MVTPGCKKFLQKDPQGILTTDQFPTSASDAILATNAVYESLRGWYYHSGGYPILDYHVGWFKERKQSRRSGQYGGTYDYFRDHPDPGTDLTVGRKRTLCRCKARHVWLRKFLLITMDATLQSRYIAEAKFLRALYYFDILFGPGAVVPLLTTTNPRLD